MVYKGGGELEPIIERRRVRVELSDGTVVEKELTEEEERVIKQVLYK